MSPYARYYPCSVEGCTLPLHGHGYCKVHLWRWQHGGDVRRDEPRRSPARGSEVERFWHYVNKNGPVPAYRPDLGPCWLWTGAKDRQGYGYFGTRLADGRPRIVKAHRYAVILEDGHLDDGLQPDHLCRVTSCVRRSHLEPVTSKVNSLRGEGVAAQNARKSHCVHGHEFTVENTRLRREGGRSCRECNRLRLAARITRPKISQLNS